MKKGPPLLAGLLLTLAPGADAKPPVFTGHANTDFDASDPATLKISDSVDDVPIPSACTAAGSAGSGWNMSNLWLYYERATDTVYVGMETLAIGGDAEGDGNPGSAHQCLKDQGGDDWADLAESEFFLVFFETNLTDASTRPNVIVGKGSYDEDPTKTVNNAFTAATYNTAFSVQFSELAFGTPLASNTGTVYANPSAAKPHVEFTVKNFSKLPGFPAGIDPTRDPISFKFGAKMGSADDTSIDEDPYPDSGQSILYTFASPKGNASGVIFSDLNGNGVRDTGEGGVAGIKVTLTGDIDADKDQDTVNVTTGSDGSYTFSNIVSGSYPVSFSEPFGYDYSTPNPLTAVITTGTVTLNPTGLKPTDTDGDTILDIVEGELPNTDGTGGPNYNDTDSDDDGIPDRTEAGSNPADPVDSDKDGKDDYVDTDSDGDTLPDKVEGAEDVDGDSTPDYLDKDVDGDGVPDGVETSSDEDGDGAPDFEDTDSDGDSLPDGLEAGANPAAPVDTDGNGEPDYLDLDSDDDGLLDSLEGGKDNDGDGLLDAYDDTDGDGDPDARDPDSDDDGLHDGTEQGITVGTANPDTDVSNPDFVPDADPATKTDEDDRDSDDDCVEDGVEDRDLDGRYDPDSNSTFDPATDETRADRADTDGDGIQDGTERGVTNGSPDTQNGVCIADADPATTTNPTAQDTDGGGRPDGQEDKDHDGAIDPGETDPNYGPDDTDLDGDGVSDSVEEEAGTDPDDIDSDDDGLSDGDEPYVDSDGDGTIDPLDLDSDNDDIQDGTESGLTGDDVTEDTEPGIFVPDADPATTTDPHDADSDDDGLEDGEEDNGDDDPSNDPDAFGDGKVDPGETDPNDVDTDDDLVQDGTEQGVTGGEIGEDTDTEVFVPDAAPETTTDPLDDDTDDDGLIDGSEDTPSGGEAFGDGRRDQGETDPENQDTDGDCLQDGTELGLTQPQGDDTDLEVFEPDSDPATTTDPLSPDSDGGGAPDGGLTGEDRDCDGAVDAGETDPGTPADDVVIVDTDGDGLYDPEEEAMGTDPDDYDSDDDGLGDGDEGATDSDGDGKIDPLDPDSDDDGIQDGTESGLTGDDVHVDTDPSVFQPDEDPSTTTNPFDIDSDDDGIDDGAEDGNSDGRVDGDETNPADPDTDDDGLQDGTESGLTRDDVGPGTDTTVFEPDADPDSTTDPLDDDSDEDGLLDGSEDSSGDGRHDAGETDPNNPDSDEDGLQDGTELGLATPEGDDTDTAVFIPDADPATHTDPLDADTDDGGVMDGGAEGEDLNVNGRQDEGERDPLDGTDDIPVINLLGGGGCKGCDSSSGRAPGAGSLFLMALTGLALRRRRGHAAGRRSGGEIARLTGLFLVGLTAVSLASSAPASAQTSEVRVEVQQFHPVPDLSGTVMTSGSAITMPSRMAFGAWLNYANDPLVVLVNGDQVARLQASVLGLDLVGVLRVNDSMQLNVWLPVTLFQRGDAESSYGDPPSSFALNDPSLSLKLRLRDRERAGLGLAIEPRVWLPAAAAGNYTGGLFSAGATVAVDRFFGQNWVGANLGYRYRPEAQTLYDLVVDDELTYRLGVGIPTRDLYWMVDLFGAVGVKQLSDGTVADAPLELMVGASKPLANGMTVNLAASTGLVAGYGTPNFRLTAGLTFGSSRDRDRDHDGLTDAVDACPDEPEDLDSFQDQDGCVDPDNDQDGIADTADRCPNDPEDRDGFQDQDGCIDPDNDQDGIPDSADRCPNDPEDRDGFQDQDGCIDPDNDKDGIADAADRCPNDPEDHDGFQDQDGCADPDNDQDGLLDAQDMCPIEPETKNDFEDTDGCPDVKVTVKDVKVEEGKLILLEKIYFDFDKDTIKKESYPILNSAAEVFRQNPDLRVSIEGHTDSKGADDYNLDLSRRRAESVMRYMVEVGGLAASRLEAKGFGETRPIDTNDTDAGRAKNRRIEWVILKKDGETPPIEQK